MNEATPITNAANAMLAAIETIKHLREVNAELLAACEAASELLTRGEIESISDEWWLSTRLKVDAAISKATTASAARQDDVADEAV